MSASPHLSKVPGASPTPERRRSRRRPIVEEQIVPVTLDGDNGGLVLDLGENGLSVQAVAPLQQGKTTEMAFVLPETRVSICALGDVRWAEPSGRAGIRLLAFSKGCSEDIRSALAQPAAPAAAASAEQVPVAPPPLPLAIDSLESDILSRKLEGAAALGYVAERTRELASASGLAIALGPARQMTCRASAGAAPPVGVQVQSDSGLSGECVRTGLLVRCDDTETDPRVDAAVCRQLDLRSAVLVPIVEGAQLRGVLEVFSSRPHAFASDDIRRFEQVATLIAKLTRETSVAVSSKPPVAPAEKIVLKAPPQAEKEVARPPVAEAAARLAGPLAIAEVEAELETEAEPEVREALPFSSRVQLTAPAVKYILLACAAIVMTFAGWAFARYRRPAAPAPAPTTVPAAVPAQAPVEPATQPVTQQVVAATPAKQEPAKVAKEQKPATKTEETAVTDDDVTIRQLPTAAASSQPEVVAPPLIVANSGALPDLSVPRAQPLPVQPRSSPNVVPGRLIRRVDPRYPDLARRTHMGGTVMLKAIIRPDGNVGKVEVISGSPMLARAAVDAVRQWKYEPFRLNGAAIQAEASIRLDFNPEVHPKQ